MSANPTARPDFRRYLRFRRYAVRYLDIQLAMLTCSTLSGFGMMLGPYLIKLNFDFAYPNRDWPLLLALAVASFAMGLLSQVGSSVQQYLQLYASQNLTFALRSDFLRHLYSLPLSFFQNRSTGEVLYRISADVPATAGFFGGIINTLVSPFQSALYPIIGIILVDWRFAIVALIAAPVFTLHSTYFGRKQRDLARLNAMEGQRISAESTDRISQIKLVKAFGREPAEIREYLSNQIKLIRLAYRGYWLGLWSGLSSNLINSVGQGALGLYLGYRVVVVGDMTLGDIIAISMYLSQLLGAAGRLASLYPSLLMQLVPVDRVVEILEHENQIKEPLDAIAPGPISGALALREVSFGYTADKPVLSGLNLEILPGTFVAIVGPSGIGKTTILNLLLRLYDPNSGEVLVDNKPLHKLRLSPFRSQVGIALQETYLFNATIGENIAYGNPRASEEEIIRAAELADAHEFIAELPQGYATRVGEAGCMLSAGQRQRIGIARALVRNPKLLIFDEATASLSVTSEAKILEAIRPRAGERTLIVVTHRLPAVSRADCIFVLEGGRIIEQGNHAELLALKGAYRELWDKQFGPPEETVMTELASADLTARAQRG